LIFFWNEFGGTELPVSKVGLYLEMPGDETPQERRERYLRQAREADELASRTRDPGIAAAFRVIARSWERLAREVREK
jgi:hypothetical protein